MGRLRFCSIQSGRFRRRSATAVDSGMGTAPTSERSCLAIQGRSTLVFTTTKTPSWLVKNLDASPPHASERSLHWRASGYSLPSLLAMPLRRRGKIVVKIPRARGSFFAAARLVKNLRHSGWAFSPVRTVGADVIVSRSFSTGKPDIAAIGRPCRTENDDPPRGADAVIYARDGDRGACYVVDRIFTRTATVVYTNDVDHTAIPAGECSHRKRNGRSGPPTAGEQTHEHEHGKVSHRRFHPHVVISLPYLPGFRRRRLCGRWRSVGRCRWRLSGLRGLTARSRLGRVGFPVGKSRRPKLW